MFTGFSAVIIIVFIAVLSLRQRLLSSTVMWLVCYFAVFLISPLRYNENNAEQIAIISFVGIVSFALGYMLYKAIPKRLTISSNEYMKSPEAPTVRFFQRVVLILSLLLLVANLGVSGISALLSGTTSLSKTLHSGAAKLGNIYALTLELLGTLSVFSYFSANTPKERKTELLMLIAFFVQVALFSFARAGIIYNLIIVIMFALRKEQTKKQIKYVVVGVGICVFLMIFGGYLRTFGLGALKDFTIYLKGVDDLSALLFSNLDFSAAYIWFSRLIDAGNVWVNPIVYLKPILMIVPRFIVPWKPEALTVQILKRLDPVRAATGYSSGMSILGEAYAILGEIGYVVYPIIWGIVCAYKDDMHFSRLRAGKYALQDILYYYYFCTMIIIETHRGDFSAILSRYLWTVFLPVWLISKYGHLIAGKRKNEIQH